ncbi:threonine-phosphate decarboxylase CobD [Selenihalanaerobacter shriftii]|uniref:threonine-phosphate decarboxylase n=1 Tax=Selenihalanaerobacter shriftii TaxID=142842 RepID=A0A1T4K4R9_9FIRM|nr:threonine-phosphate decarboxylase CobD [Selenihalanaerobacter shriftii]SJZ37406.1 L-threonine O-3-phosphate decarboxylase [Selenihalanaerobacter shriftii]
MIAQTGKGSINMVNNSKMHGGNIKAAAKEYDLQLEEIIDFSANINFLGPPSVVEEEIKASLDQIIHYPEPEAKTLCNELADYFGIQSRNVIVGNGEVELIYLISKVIQPSHALVLAPTFSEYEAAVESVGGKIELFKLSRYNNFKIDMKSLFSKLEESDIDLLFLCNPNNPTGDLITKSELLKLVEVAKNEETFVVLDEAFLDFLMNESEYTLISEAVQQENLLVLRSMTKFFAVPGLRIGYGIGNANLISKLESSKDPWNVNLFAQQVGVKVLKEDTYITKTKGTIKQEKEFLYQQLNQLKGLNPYRPTVNYILIDISDTEYNSQQLKSLLASKGILVRDCSTYHLLGKDFIRVAVKNREDNQKLIKELKLLLDLGGQ